MLSVCFVELEFESTLAGCLGECQNPTVVLIVPTIKSYTLDAGSRSFFGNCLADRSGSIAVSAGTDIRTHGFVAGTGTDQRFAGEIINHLTTEMLQRPVDTHPWLLRATSELVAHMLTASQSFLLKFLVLIHLITTRASCNPAVQQAVLLGSVLFSCGLTRLDFDLLTLIANSFAFVRLRLSQRSHFGGELAYLLLVATLNDNVRLIRASHA